MARIRTIKPEFWSSEQVVELSPTARLLFIGLWNFCDDGGNHPASARTLKMQVFPGDDFTAEQVNGWIAEIIAAGLITEYQSDARSYWHVTGWHHQKIEKPNYRYPAPEFADHSPTDRRPFDPVRECNSNGKGKEGSESNARAHEDGQAEKQKKENAPPLPPSNGGGDPYDPYHPCIEKINTWGKENNWGNLRDFAASVDYDPEKYGSVRDEVKKFTAHFLNPSRGKDREYFIADPARFFQEKGRKWLLDAKNMNRPKKDTRPYTTPPRRTSPPYTTPPRRTSPPSTPERGPGGEARTIAEILKTAQ